MSNSLMISTTKPEGVVDGSTGAAVCRSAPVFDYAALADALAANLRDSAKRIHQRVQSTIFGLIEIGRDLNAAKDQLDHGQFVLWLEAEIGIHPRTAQRYMSVAAFAEGKNDMMSFLTPNIAYKLAAKRTPPEVVEAVRKTIEAGEPVKEHDLDRLLSEYKRARKPQNGLGEPPVQKASLTGPVGEANSEATATVDPAADAKAKAHLLLRDLGPERVRLVVEALRTNASAILVQLETVLVSNTATEPTTPPIRVAPAVSPSTMPDLPASLDRRTGSKGAAV